MAEDTGASTTVEEGSVTLEERHKPIIDVTGQMGAVPELPPGTEATYTGQEVQSNELLTQQTAGEPPKATAEQVATVPQAQVATPNPAAVYDAAQVAQPGELEAAQGEVSEEAEQDAPQGTITEQATAATGTAAEATAASRTVQNNELITAATAGEIPEGEAAQAVVDQQATAKYQLGQLLEEFNGTGLPAFAAPAIRKAMDLMAARGLSQSSMAGDAIMRAALESSIPIAIQDANTYAKYGLANLEARQQTSVTNAQIRAALRGQELTNEQQARVMNAARIAEVNNMNLSNEQATVLENAKIMQNMNLANLSAKNQTVLQNAATMAQMDTANLNSRLTAAVNNAKAFLNMDMANLSNQQQAQTLSYQAQVQKLMSDAAAQNAALQFNAKNEQQQEQFFANLGATVDTNNANRAAAMSQFNVEQGNAIEKFNIQVQDLRERFNSEMGLAIDQSNTVWRRALNTANNAGQNRINELNAQSMLGLSVDAQNKLWQQYRDEASFLFDAGENAKNRAHNMAVAAMQSQMQKDLYAQAYDDAWSSQLGEFGFNVLGVVLNAGAKQLKPKPSATDAGQE